MRDRFRQWFVGAIALILSTQIPAVALAAPIVFAVDDGTSDIAFGNFSGGPADVLIVNQFDAGAGGATINTIQYVFGTPAAGGATLAVPLQVVLFEDNDDDASIDNATLLAAVADVPTQIDNDVFNSVVIPPTFVTGRFFVGVFATGIATGQALVGADTNDPPGATYAFAGTALDLNNILGTADIFSHDPEGTGIALIRAVGEIPEPTTLATLVGGLAALALAKRRRSSFKRRP